MRPTESPHTAEMRVSPTDPQEGQGPVTTTCLVLNPQGGAGSLPPLLAWCSAQQGHQAGPKAMPQQEPGGVYVYAKEFPDDLQKEGAQHLPPNKQRAR